MLSGRRMSARIVENYCDFAAPEGILPASTTVRRRGAAMTEGGKADAKREYRRLVADVLGIIRAHDPLLLSPRAPLDEYEPQARAIARRAKHCTTPDACLDVIWNVFCNHFGESAGKKEVYESLARDIYVRVNVSQSV